MDRLYELGKRFERLLYSSILVIIASYITYSLLNSLITYESLDLLNAYKTVKQSIEQKKQNIHELNKTMDIVIKRINVINRINPEQKTTSGAIKDKAESSPLETRMFNIYKDIINKERRDLGLHEVNSIYEAEDYMRDIVKNVINEQGFKVDTRQKLKQNILDSDRWLNYNDAITWINKAESELSKNKIEIANIETQITIPFTIGDMKSNIPLMRIATTAVFIMPVFMVIWLGSISVTREFEINTIKKTKDLTLAYPHIFNLFYVDDGKTDTLQRALLGDEKAQAGITVALRVFSIIKIAMYLSLFFLMCAPLYIGIFRYVTESYYQNSVNTLMSVCSAINLFQAFKFIQLEWQVSDRIYAIKNNAISECIIRIK